MQGEWTREGGRERLFAEYVPTGADRYRTAEICLYLTKEENFLIFNSGGTAEILPPSCKSGRGFFCTFILITKGTECMKILIGGVKSRWQNEI